MKQLETRVVLSHLVFGAKPCYNILDKPEASVSKKKRKRA